MKPNDKPNPTAEQEHLCGYVCVSVTLSVCSTRHRASGTQVLHEWRHEDWETGGGQITSFTGKKVDCGNHRLVVLSLIPDKVLEPIIRPSCSRELSFWFFSARLARYQKPWHIPWQPRVERSGRAAGWQLKEDGSQALNIGWIWILVLWGFPFLPSPRGPWHKRRRQSGERRATFLDGIHSLFALHPPKKCCACSVYQDLSEQSFRRSWLHHTYMVKMVSFMVCIFWYN